MARLRSAAQCLDLLDTCWTLERTRLLHEGDEDGVSETESEPGPERDLEASGMGQRASSTSSLHVKTPTTTAPGRVSLTWALLKRPPSTQPPAVLITSARVSPARSGGGRTRAATSQPLEPGSEVKEATVKPQQTTPQVPRHRSHRSESSIKRFGYDIHDVDEFLSKVSVQS